MQPEKASCHLSLPNLATDKVDHREMSALRPCPSNTRTSSQESVGSDWEGEGVRQEDGEGGRQTWTGSVGRGLQQGVKQRGASQRPSEAMWKLKVLNVTPHWSRRNVANILTKPSVSRLVHCLKCQ